MIRGRGFLALKDALWPKRHQKGQPRRHLGGPDSSHDERTGYVLAMGEAAYYLDRMPFGRRLALAWVVLTWPWQD